MIRAYKYKLRPNKGQAEMLSKHLGCARFIYNWGLLRNKKEYEKSKKRLSYNDLARALTALKKQEEYSWLNEVSNMTLQQSLRHLDSAFSNFFRDLKKGKVSFPKFKSKHNHNDGATYTESKIDFDRMRVYVPKIGWVRICKNRTFDTSFRHTSMTIRRDTCGTYWVSIVVDDNKADNPTKTKADCKRTLGIDVGLKTFITDSEGNKVDNPRFLERSLKRLAVLQRRLSRTKNGSHRHEVARIKVAKYHRKIRDARLDFLHKLTTRLATSYDAICIEDLDIHGLLEKGIVSKSVSSASWNTFASFLEYKCKANGCHLVKVDRYFASSQLCSVCGHKHSDVRDLSVRTWICPECDTKHDRDFNAAINILREGMKKVV